MPETDWLTGLSSRLAFARQVTQADRDRDPFTIALIAIADFAEVNRLLGYDTGDDLLRTIGRVLGQQTSVNIVAGRLDGTQFGLLAHHLPGADSRSWLQQIVAATRAAIADWTFDQIDFNGHCAVEPDVVVGTASGCSSQVWIDAAAALEIAGTDLDSAPIVEYIAEDPRFVALRRRRDAAERIATALGRHELVSLARMVEPVYADAPSWRWLRVDIGRMPRRPAHPVGLAGEAAIDTGAAPEPQPLDCSMVPPGLGRRLEKWLVDRAGAAIAAGCGQVRLTVPVTGEIDGGSRFGQRLQRVMDRNLIPPSRIIFEVDEAVLLGAAARGRAFCDQIDEIGSTLVLAGCNGGWRTWQALDELPIEYVKPKPALVERTAAGDRAAGRILSTLVDNASGADYELIAPRSGIARAALADLGFTYRERERVTVLPDAGSTAQDRRSDVRSH